MISARTAPIDIVSGPEAGTDDCVTEPFVQVLSARLRSVVRRAGHRVMRWWSGAGDIRD